MTRRSAKVGAEPAREHLRNALQMLEINGADDENGDGDAVVVYLESDVDAIMDRLDAALAALEKGNA